MRDSALSVQLKDVINPLLLTAEAELEWLAWALRPVKEKRKNVVVRFNHGMPISS
jgi:hypothetical protein